METFICKNVGIAALPFKKFTIWPKEFQRSDQGLVRLLKLKKCDFDVVTLWQGLIFISMKCFEDMKLGAAPFSLNFDNDRIVVDWILRWLFSWKQFQSGNNEPKKALVNKLTC